MDLSQSLTIFILASQGIFSLQVETTHVFTGMQNETIEGVVGTQVELPCKINHHDENDFHLHVLWHKERQTLTFNSKRIIDDPRFKIVTTHFEDNSWNLVIDQLTKHDEGIYKCIVNTRPPAIKYIELLIKVAPTIDNELTTSDLTIKEGDTLKLHCEAQGIPKPIITWFRILTNPLGEEIRSVVKNDSKALTIENVTRHCEGIYECMAHNTIYPDAHRRIVATVLFKPEVKMINTKIAQMRGESTILQCHITSNPLENIYWLYQGRELQPDSGCTSFRVKYCQDIWKSSLPHVVQVDLTVTNLSTSDYGIYICVAHSIVGTSNSSVFLIEEKDPHSQPEIMPIRQRSFSTTYKTVSQKNEYASDVSPYTNPARSVHVVNNRGGRKWRPTSVLLIISCAVFLKLLPQE